MTRVFGLIGRIASGKSVVSDYLIEEKGARYLRFSDVLRDILLRLHIENTRDNLINLGTALRSAFNDDILARCLKSDIEAMDAEELVVVDGIRYRDEFDMLKALGGRIIYIRSDAKTRYERVISRATRGEGGLSFDEFLENEDKPTERMIDELGMDADIIIDNESSLEDLMAKIHESI